MECKDCCCNDVKILLRLARDDSVICAPCLNAGHVRELDQFKKYHEHLLGDRDIRLLHLSTRLNGLETNVAKEKEALDKRIKQLEHQGNIDGQQIKLLTKQVRILNDELVLANKLAAQRKKTNTKSESEILKLTEAVAIRDKRHETAKKLIKDLNMAYTQEQSNFRRLQLHVAAAREECDVFAHAIGKQIDEIERQHLKQQGRSA